MWGGPQSKHNEETVWDANGVSGVALPMISPYAKFVLNHRDKQCSHKQIDSWGAVGCYLSHVQCWEWLLGQPPNVPSALILEDDACFDPTFVEVWTKKVVPLRQQNFPNWDVIMLGFFEVSGDVAAVVHGIDVRRIDRGGSFFGMHGYLINRHGAAVLREHAYPIVRVGTATTVSSRSPKYKWMRTY